MSRYGVSLAHLGKAGLFIRGLQQINRIVPHDPEPRRPFIAGRVSPRAGLETLVDSYQEQRRRGAKPESTSRLWC